MRRLIGSLLQVAFVVASRAMVSIATLLSVPIIIAQAGTEFWVSTAVGQVVGEVGRAICAWGFGGRIAYLSSLPVSSRARFFRLSFWGRCLIAALMIPLLLVVVAMLTDTHQSIALWMTLAGSLNGLGASWYFVATGQSSVLISADALPRALGILAGALSLYVLPAAAYGWGMGGLVALGSVCSVAVPALLILRPGNGSAGQRSSLNEVWRSLQAGIPALVYSLSLTVRLSLPLAITAGVASGSSSAVALSDKFIRWGNTGASPLAEVIQAKAKDSGPSIAARVKRTTLVSGCMGLLLAVTLVATVPFLSRLISVGEISLGVWETTAIATCVSAMFVSSVTSLALVPLIGRNKITAWASLVSLLVVAILVYPFTLLFGPIGALWALASGEIVVLLLTHVEISRGLRDRNLANGSFELMKACE